MKKDKIKASNNEMSIVFYSMSIMFLLLGIFILLTTEQEYFGVVVTSLIASLISFGLYSVFR